MILWIQWLILAAVVYAVVPILTPMHSRHMRENYRGQMIPVGLGIGFVLPAVAVIVWTGNVGYDFLLGIVILSFALIGYVDDMLGYENVQGFHGHFSLLTSRQLSGGGFKALAGGVIALVVSSRMVDGVIPVLISGSIMALSANLVNLLDRRPGRAAKVFLIFAVLLVLVNRRLQGSLMPLVVAVSGYTAWDLRGKVMMGDAGANALGAGLGWALVHTVSLPWSITVFVVLVFLNVLSEKVSFSRIIESNRILRFWTVGSFLIKITAAGHFRIMWKKRTIVNLEDNDAKCILRTRNFVYSVSYFICQRTAGV